MPNQPYEISGHVYDVNGTTALSGATVTLYNETLGEEIISGSQAITASDGSYSVNAGDTKTAFSNGDIIVVEARKDYKLAQSRTTINTDNGYDTIDLIMVYEDPLGLVKDLLTDNWQKGRTDNILPSFEITKDTPTNVDLQSNDRVRIYALKTLPRANALGADSRYVRHPITIEVVCAIPKTNDPTSYYPTANSHATKMMKEVDRILRSKINNPVSDNKHNILDPHGGWIDLSDKSRQIGKWAYDIALEELNETW